LSLLALRAAALLDEPRVGPVSAAQLLVAWSHHRPDTLPCSQQRGEPGRHPDVPALERLDERRGHRDRGADWVLRAGRSNAGVAGVVAVTGEPQQ
jgi:hypothetical protein